MAKQLNLLSGQIITTALHTEMQQSYLEYAMSVIVGRALPDVRDGLKPVHRRILYAMHELGLTPDRPFRKCARVVGDVLGKYHPHGDQAVYDALVRLVQEFSSRYPLLSGHGNFGSVDNDPPAAMRYTETRLAPVSQEAMLAQIGESTVDFISNFDNSQQEPTVLPAQLPFLLLNGCSGIAVGMATNIPPHNLGEVVDGLIALIDHPNLSDEKLLELIPGPDFPTGGEIIATDGIVDTYISGRGSITIRGIVRIEEMQVGKSRRSTRTAIVVTELPYQVNKAGWIEKTADLINAGRIEGIADIRDESDREGIRVVIELKREASPEVVLHHLYKHTDLQSKFGAILLTIVDGQPRQLSLKQLLEEFLKFREATLLRHYTYELEQARRRCHVVEGLLIALKALDDLIEILRNAPDGSTAKNTLVEELELSETQADAILAMPMRRLTGLEQQRLQDEFEELTATIRELEELINDRRELLKALKKELRALKRKYGDARRTRIISVVSQEDAETPEIAVVAGKKSAGKAAKRKGETEEEIDQASVLALQPAPPPEEEAFLEFTHRGYVRRLATKGRKQAVIRELTAESSEDVVINATDTMTGQNLAVLTRLGKAYPLKVGDIPVTSNRGRGTPLVTLLSPSATKDVSGSTQEIIVNQFLLSDEVLETKDLVMLTQQGKIKRLPMFELSELTNRGITVIKLKEDDELLYAQLVQTGAELVLGTSGGRLMRLEVNDEQIPPMGRAAQGSQATRLRKQEQLVGFVSVKGNDDLLLVSEQGFVKRVPVSRLQRAARGGIGTQGLRFAVENDVLAGLANGRTQSVIQIYTSQNRLFTVPVETVKPTREGAGEDLLELEEGERVIMVQ